LRSELRSSKKPGAFALDGRPIRNDATASAGDCSAPKAVIQRLTRLYPLLNGDSWWFAARQLSGDEPAEADVYWFS